MRLSNSRDRFDSMTARSSPACHATSRAYSARAVVSFRFRKAMLQRRGSEGGSGVSHGEPARSEEAFLLGRGWCRAVESESAVRARMAWATTALETFQHPQGTARSPLEVRRRGRMSRLRTLRWRQPRLHKTRIYCNGQAPRSWAPSSGSRTRGI